MLYDAIIFTDIFNNNVPLKSMGAYKIAASMRSKGYAVKVINNFLELYHINKQDFLVYIKSVLKSDAKFIGISGTFMPTNQSIRKSSSGVQIINGNPYDLFKELMIDLKKLFRNIPIVIGGGSYSTKMAFETLKEIDYWIDGLAESGIIKFLESSNRQRHFRYDVLGVRHDFHNSRPVFQYEDGIMNQEVLPLEISRGCRFKCKFCSYPLLGKDVKDIKYYRSEESIYVELMHNYEKFGTTKYILLCDTFNESNDKVNIFYRAVQRSGIKINFVAYMRLDLIHAFPEQIDILKETGVLGAYFGLESLHHPTAKAIGKGLSKEKIQDTLANIKKVWKDDAMLHANFIAGLPHESADTLNLWCQEILDGKFQLDSFYITPLVFMKTPNFLSDFEMHPEKYNYEIIKTVGKNDFWKNDLWSYQEAAERASYWQSKFDKVSKLSSFVFMGLHNYNIYDRYRWEEIRRTTFDDVINNKTVIMELKQLKKRYILDYWDVLTNVEV